MGTDIHFYAQLRDAEGKWRTQGQECKYNETREGDELEYPNGENEYYKGRNYDLFAILANIRNGRGSAGVKTGEGFEIIDEPRGVPEDVNDKRLADYLVGWLHTPSWFTLDELVFWDGWTKETTHQGCVDPVEWAQWKISGKPRSWSGGVSGRSVRHFAPEQFQEASGKEGSPYDLFHGEKEALSAFRAALGLKSGEGAYTTVKWTEKYYVSAGSFWQSTIPRLLELMRQRKTLYGVDGGMADVRVVFGFDS